MFLLRNLLIIVFDICFEVTFLILKLLNKVGLTHGLFLQIFRQLITPRRIILFLTVISSLHLRLLHKHLLLNLINLLLFFDFHLVYDSAVFLPELGDVIHELLICILRFLISLFHFLVTLSQIWSIIVVLVSELRIVLLGLFVLSSQVFLDSFIIALLELQP